MLTENGNRDICVADLARGCVVVVDVAGELLFRYHGNISQQSKNSSFGPYEIASDVNHQIIINDSLNDIVHIIDIKILNQTKCIELLPSYNTHAIASFFYFDLYM